MPFFDNALAGKFKNLFHGARNFALDKAIQLRDGVIVPAIDTAMEAGVIPADAGMFGRYLTGTNTPLTRMPADIKKAEHKMSSTLVKKDAAKAKDPKEIARREMASLIKQQFDTGVNIKSHNLGLETFSPEKVSEWKATDSRMKELEEIHGQIGINPIVADLNYRTQIEPFDPNNYNTTRYKNLKYMADLGGVSPTTNSLGQYSVRDGIITDRYDFDYNNGYGSGPGGRREWDGKFDHGGAIEQGDTVQNLAGLAGNLSHNLGLIKPGSGYDVRLDTGRR